MSQSSFLRNNDSRCGGRERAAPEMHDASEALLRVEQNWDGGCLLCQGFDRSIAQDQDYDMRVQRGG